MKLPLYGTLEALIKQHGAATIKRALDAMLQVEQERARRPAADNVIQFPKRR